MEPTFACAHRIWCGTEYADDEYCDFLIRFDAEKGDRAELFVTCDGQYALYGGDRLISFGQYGDYADYKVYDTVDLTPCLQNGTNEFILTVWHFGVNSQTYINKGAGALFEVHKNRRPVLFSDASVLCRRTPGYIPHRGELITSQLGITFAYDAGDVGGKWGAASLLPDVWSGFTPRPVEKLTLYDRSVSTPVKCGGFDFPAERMRPAKAMNKAALREAPCGDLPLRISAGDADGSDGCFFIVDLQSEQTGILDFDIEFPCDCTVYIGWGEHLLDGRCRTAVRNFQITYKANAGRNCRLFPLLRLGCRYIQFFIAAPSAVVFYAGLRQTLYPLDVRPYESPENPARRAIYDVCVNTLRQCMHEHYEDCPWREQSLYTLDSRNQMLCGYPAFGETAFPRACLELISHGVRSDGLLSLCYPAGTDLPIPSYSLVYFLQMREYLDHSGDLGFIGGKYGFLCALIDVFDRRAEDGLLRSFPDSEGYWNFYEWTEGMSGGKGGVLEAPLNAFFSLALSDLAYIARRLGKADDADRFAARAEEVNSALASSFFDAQARLFRSFEDRAHGKFSVLTNALCLLCGAAQSLDRSVILEILQTNSAGDTGLYVIPNSLSMNGFRFDALLSVDREKYRNVILAELDRDYGYMLSQGATSFWETLAGAADFGGAGSLCHGWSALPAYYYRLLEA